MCTRFVYNGNDMITGFNFDIDLAVWKHKVIKEKERFYIGILRPDGTYHSYHGINRNGNVGTIPLVGRTIFEQQKLLYNSLLEWLNNFEAQMSKE